MGVFLTNNRLGVVYIAYGMTYVQPNTFCITIHTSI